MKNSHGIVALALAGALALTGCSALDSASAPEAPRATPSADATTPLPQPAPEAVAALPADCSETVDAAIRAKVEENFALNPAWRVAQEDFRAEPLLADVEAKLECAWVSPRGPGDGGIITTFARFDPAQREARAARAAELQQTIEHHSVIVGRTVLVETVWGDNGVPDGYLASVERFAD